MKRMTQQVFTGERALFKACDLDLHYCTFADGESPLKESTNIRLSDSSFKWKYPLWYSENIEIANTTWFETARAGVWYTKHIAITDSIIEAPKNFRRSQDIALTNTTMPNAEETLWNCEGIVMNQASAHGDYFAMNSTDITIDGFSLVGNYSFDGTRNVTIKNARMLSKDAFWNAENVVVMDSYISGEYLGWNAKNVRFVNCTIESEQGMCYMDGITMEHYRLINTDLCFEYCCNVDATIESTIDSVKNPYNGRIEAEGIGNVIFDDPHVDPSQTEIRLAPKCASNVCDAHDLFASRAAG